MASTPTTPRAPLSPKLNLPPMTISPQVTRLDRVLDLVTSHEAQFRGLNNKAFKAILPGHAVQLERIRPALESSKGIE